MVGVLTVLTAISFTSYQPEGNGGNNPASTMTSFGFGVSPCNPSNLARLQVTYNQRKRSTGYLLHMETPQDGDE